MNARSACSLAAATHDLHMRMTLLAVLLVGCGDGRDARENEAERTPVEEVVRRFAMCAPDDDMLVAADELEQAVRVCEACEQWGTEPLACPTPEMDRRLFLACWDVRRDGSYCTGVVVEYQTRELDDAFSSCAWDWAEKAQSDQCMDARLYGRDLYAECPPDAEERIVAFCEALYGLEV